MPSQEHMQPHPAVSVGQQLSSAVPQMIYPAQQMQVIDSFACVSASVYVNLVVSYNFSYYFHEKWLIHSSK